MVTTRSRDSASAAQNSASPKTQKTNGATPTKRKAQDAEDKSPDAKLEKQTDVKRNKTEETTGKEGHGTKKDVEAEGSAEISQKTESSKDKLSRLIASYGQIPLQHLISSEASASQTVMIHILNALLSSARISHTIAGNTLKSLIKADYHDLETLEDSTWDERCKVLTEGGYTRYREKTATYLGDLVELMGEKYENNAEKMLPKDEEGQKARDNLSKRLQEIKGLGPVGVDIFLGSIQTFFPNVAPFLDKRSKETAEKIGLEGNLDKIFDMVGQKAGEMAKVEVALTMVRLEGKENEFAT